jgi:hypothetical protein
MIAARPDHLRVTEFWRHRVERVVTPPDSQSD